jgi:hypothetical protein
MGVDYLTDEEKVRIRHHLGYLNVDEASTFAIGMPAGVETQFMIEGAFSRLLPAAIPQVRKLLRYCECTEEQRFGSQPNAAVKEVDGIVMGAAEEQNMLSKNYDHWRAALSNMFGTVPNPFDHRYAGGGLNLRVNG